MIPIWHISVVCLHLNGCGGALHSGVHPVHHAWAQRWDWHDPLHQHHWCQHWPGHTTTSGAVGGCKHCYFLLFRVLFADLIISNFQGILALSIIDHASMVFFTAGEILAWKLNFSCWIFEEPKCSLQILGLLVQMFGWITLIFAREYWKVLNEFSMLAQLPVYDVQCGM